MENQRAFIHREFFSMTLSATTQRAYIYKPNTAEKDRRPLHESLRTALEELAKGYSSQIDEDQHSKNILFLAHNITEKHRTILAEEKFRIGPSQKALNLYLKYLWCLGEIPTPPHCPIDAIVLKHIPRFTTELWTKLDDIKQYEKIILAAKDEAKGLALAQWELEIYNGAVNRSIP